MSRNYYRRLPEELLGEGLTCARGKPSHWSYNPINADATVLTSNGAKTKMAPIKESEDDDADRWVGVSSHDEPKSTHSSASAKNTNNSASQTHSPTAPSDDEKSIIETDL